MTYQAVIWDLDGTLLDTSEGVADAVRMTLEELHLPAPTEAELRRYVGPPMPWIFSHYFGMDEAQALAAANRFRANYKAHSLLKAQLYPGMEDLLRDLRAQGVRMAVATNKSHENAMQILRHFHVDRYCEVMHGSDLTGKLTKADIIRLCLDELHVSPADAVYIGDSRFDREGAESVGMAFIGCTYGFGFRAEETNPFPTAASVTALHALLQEGSTC